MSALEYHLVAVANSAVLEISSPLAEAVRLLLKHSWADVDFQYDGLTSQEQACITREQHASIVEWVKR